MPGYVEGVQIQSTVPGTCMHFASPEAMQLLVQTQHSAYKQCIAHYARSLLSQNRIQVQLHPPP